MLLLDLKNYVQEKKSVSLTDIATHFHIPGTMAESMLETWVKQGVIEKHLPTLDELPSCMRSKNCPRCTLKQNPASVSYTHLTLPTSDLA